MLPVIALLLWSFVDVLRKEGRKAGFGLAVCWVVVVVVVIVVVVLSFEKGKCMKS
jgi:hypothetical protein